MQYKSVFPMTTNTYNFFPTQAKVEDDIYYPWISRNWVLSSFPTPSASSTLHPFLNRVSDVPPVLKDSDCSNTNDRIPSLHQSMATNNHSPQLQQKHCKSELNSSPSHSRLTYHTVNGTVEAAKIRVQAELIHSTKTMHLSLIHI